MVRLRLYAMPGARVCLHTLHPQAGEQIYPMTEEGSGCYAARVYAPDVPCIWGYRFEADDGVCRRYYGSRDVDGRGGEGCESDNAAFFRVTVYDPAFDTPHFLRHGCMYQIFPDRFFAPPGVAAPEIPAERRLHTRWDEPPLVDPDPRSGDNRALDFFGGTLRGIREKLPYLQSLGVTVLYLNPIFQARTNHRYDTGDYRHVDALLGSDADFSALCAQAACMGIRVLLDGVFSHTGEDSLYFNRYGHYASLGAYQSPDSPYADWYRFIHFPDEYRCWWGVPTLPEINKANADWRALITGENGVVGEWIQRGASGWRLDVADELPMEVLRDIRRAAKDQSAQAVVLCEVWEDASRKIAYGQTRSYCLGDTADSVMNYPLRECAIGFFTGERTAGDVRETILHQMEMYPKPFFYSLMNLAGSHDRARTLNLLAQEDFSGVPWGERGACRLTKAQYALGASRIVKLYTLLTALPGIPCVYYGDEAGMTGGSDPFCRGSYPWGQEDADIRAAIAGLLRTRMARPVFQTGDLEVEAPDDDTLCVRRFTHAGRDVFGEPMKDDEVTVILSRTDERIHIKEANGT